MEPTLSRLLRAALIPLGSTMYVYGGGWNKTDNGAAEECRRLGADPRWKSFFEKQNPDYDHRKYRYSLGNGLDCSGYAGWVIYQTMERENGREGYVMPAKDMAENFAARGWGNLREHDRVADHCPGDIMSGRDHVWISLGTCADGSVLLIHSSPPGVSLCGTVTPEGKENSDALRLAAQTMARYYPRWHGKYPCCLRGASYLRDYDQMRWDLSGKGILTDPEGCAIMNPKELIRYLFSEKEF